MLILKACAKCRGDLYVEQSGSVSELVCLQCGYRRRQRIPEPVVSRQAA